MGWEELSLDRIYFDSDTGVAGTIWPIGTPRVPSDVIADVITICAARNLYKIEVHGALTLGAAMQHYCFFGAEHEDITDTLDLSDEDVDGSHIEGLIVTGGQGGATFLTLIRCIVNAVTVFNGRMNNCSFWGGVTSSFKDAGYIDLVDCDSIYGAVTITVQAPTRASIKNWKGNLILTAQDGGACFVRGIKGTLEIDAMTLGTLGVYANGADITINANCTGGTINIYGNARVTDNSGATVVNDYSKETQLDAIEGLIAAGIAIQGAVSDAGPAITDFDTDLAEATDDHYNNMLLMFLDGPNAGQAHTIDNYTGATRNVWFSAGDQWTDVPVDGNSFVILPSSAQKLLATLATLAGTLAQILTDTGTTIPATLATIAGYLDTEIAAILAAVDTEVASILEDTGTTIPATLATIAAYIDTEVAAIITSQGKMLFSMDFWSDTQEELQVTAGGTTETLPSVTIAEVPGTFVRAIAMFKFRMVENTYAGVNAINGAQHIQVQKAAGAWQNAISLVDTLCTLADAAREGGDVWIGDHDIAGEVDANAAYNFQWLNADSLFDFIQFNDIQVGLRIFYSI